MANMIEKRQATFDFTPEEPPAEILERARAFAVRLAEERSPPHVSILDVRAVLGRTASAELAKRHESGEVFAGPRWSWTGKTVALPRSEHHVRVWRLAPH